MGSSTPSPVKRRAENTSSTYDNPRALRAPLKMHFFRDCGVSAVLESSCITYHCCPIEHTNPLKFLEKLFSCLKHNAIVNFLWKSIGYTLCLTILWDSSDDLYTAVVRAVLPCTHETMTIFRGALELVRSAIRSPRFRFMLE